MSERRQCGDGSGGVGEVEVGVDVHGQADVAVSHEFLCRGGHDAVFRHQRGEGVSHRVDVHRAALGVHLWNAGGDEVAVERPQQVSPIEAKQRRLGRDGGARTIARWQRGCVPLRVRLSLRIRSP